MSLSFGDNVEIYRSTETDEFGLSRKKGQIFGETKPSCSGVDVIGELENDYAINVFFKDLDKSFWIAPQLVKFLDHGEGTECILGNIRAVRNKDGSWQEYAITNPPKNQKTLLDEKYEKFKADQYGYTKLMCALETRQSIGVIARLINEGANVNDCESDMFRAFKPVLRFALDRGTDPDSIDIIRLLVRKGADLEAQTYNRVEDDKTYGFMTLFHYAVIYSSPEVIQMFVDAGANVNYWLPPHSGLENSRTPLESAKLLKRQDVAQVLQRVGAREKDSLLGSTERTRLQGIKGSLIAGAVGDAMGRVTEFSSLNSIFKRYPNGIRSFDDFNSEDFWTDQDGNKIAPYTDDTRMALLVFDTMRKARLDGVTLDVAMTNLAQRFVWDMEDNPKGWAMPARAPGIATLKNVKKLASKMHQLKPQHHLKGNWWVAGEPDDGGSGSVMRSYPFGLVFHDDIKKAEEWAVANSKLTHGASISFAASAAIAVGTAHALHREDPSFIAQQMVDAARKYDEPTAIMIEKAIDYAKRKEDPRIVLDEFQGWAAHEAIAAVVYVFLMEPDDIQKAIYIGVHSPGDSDTIASIAGALVGSRKGVSNIPEDWIRTVEDSEFIIDLANQCF